MNTHPKIIIDKAPGTLQSDTDGADLIHCYFQARENGRQWRLHQPDSHKIKTEPHHLVSGTDFSFTFDDLCWNVTNFLLWKDSDTDIWYATGSWAAHQCPPTQGDPSDTGDDPETGTFQAQSGGGGDPERTAIATA